MSIHTKTACLALALCFVATQASHAKESKLPGKPQSQNRSTNLCPPKKPAYTATLNETLDKMSLGDLTALADQGRADAMVILGLRYTPSENPAGSTASVQPDLKKAISLFQRAADQKNSDAEFIMGSAYAGGLGVPKNEVTATSWFKRGADHGNVPAQFWAGEMIAKGRGGSAPDWKAALPYFVKAADGGAADGYFEIGFMYTGGLGGLQQNYEKAAYCYRQSIAVGSQMAQFNLRMLISDGKIILQPGDPRVELDTAPKAGK